MTSAAFFALSLVFTVTAANAAFARSGPAPVSTTSSERGAFSFHIGYGLEENKMLNSDGTESRFRGKGMLANLDLRFGEGGPGEFRLFGLAKTIDSQASLDSSVKMKSSSIAGGLKVFTLEWLYFGGGMGATTQNIKDSAGSVTVTNQYYFAQTGVEIHLGGSFYFDMVGMAQVNPIRKAEGMTSHSFTDGYGGYFMLSYAPPSLITNIISP